MKKIITFVFVCFLFASCFVSAREPWKIALKRQVLSGSYLSGQNKKINKIWSWLNLLSWNKLLSGLQINKKLSKTWFCITWDQLIIRDTLSNKAQEASKKLYWLIKIASKIKYPTDKITLLAQKLQTLSSKIKNDCSPNDFKTHRDQIKSSLVLLKEEIASLKKYIYNIRNR